MRSSRASRRVFLQSLSLAPAALLLAGGQKARAQAAATPATPVAGACAVDPSNSTISLVQFVAVSPDAAQVCHGCSFWTGDASGNCGACAILMTGTPPTGHCISWTARAA